MKDCQSPTGLCCTNWQLWCVVNKEFLKIVEEPKVHSVALYLNQIQLRRSARPSEYLLFIINYRIYRKQSK